MSSPSPPGNGRQRALNAFRERFGGPPEFLVRAPGRVNLIGEHTDYNDGLVLPMAIDRSLWLAGRRRTDAVLQLHSLDQRGSVGFGLGPVPSPGAPGAAEPLTSPESRESAAALTSPGTPRSQEAPGNAAPVGPAGPAWGRYVRAVANRLVRGRTLPCGLEGVLASEIPVGAGLSSSAALELATARALHAAWDEAWQPTAMARLCHRAESEGVGVACGVMDQMIVATASEGCARRIDCRSLESMSIRMPPKLLVAVLDTGTRRDLSGSAFNQRRRECEAAAAAVGLTSLRDLEPDALRSARLTGALLRRARHVVTENGRVEQFARALERGETARLGELLAASHASLRDDYEVVTPALDAMVESARAAPGCLGARMTGAGFGGCAMALLECEAAPDFAATVEADYARRTAHQGCVFLCRPAAGVSLADPSPASPRSR